MIQALRGLQVLQGLLEQTAQCQDLQVQPVQLVLLEPLVQQVRLDLQVQRVPQGRLVQLALREQPELLVLQDQLVRQVQMQLLCQAYLC